MKVIVAGALANKPLNGGEAWVRLSWIRGLQALGADVRFIEQIAGDACTDAAGRSSSFQDSINLEYFRDVTRAFGLGSRSALIVDRPEASRSNGSRGVTVWHDADLMKTTELVEAWTADADLLINISGHLTHGELLLGPAVRAYVDIDPGFTQFWLAQPETTFHIAPHDLYFTIAENLGRSDCSIPDGGLRWLPARQPVVLSDWPETEPDPDHAFTTIASWRGAFGPVEFDGRRFGLKVHEFRRFAELPTMTSERLRIALDIHEADHRDRALLEEHGWILDDPRTAVPDPASFHQYIAASKGEFSVAQGIYVDTNSGWFSDRTTRYLAAGRPAVVQDTGFSRNLPVGDGLLSFASPQTAAASIDDVARRYDHHARAARQVAEEHFDACRVLSRFLDDVDAFRSRRRAGTSAANGRHEQPAPVPGVGGKRRLKILVSGMIAAVPGQGGAVWAVLQYVLGLIRLGHEVMFVETLDDAAIQPAGERLAASANAACLDAVGAVFGINDRLALVHGPSRSSHGIELIEIERFASRADVLINLSGLLRERALFDPVPTRVYVDLDPAFTQLWSDEHGIDMRFDGHTHFATVGLSIGRPECSIPTCGLDWIPIVQPVVLDQWPRGTGIEHMALTGIANWRGYGSIDREGTFYGQKAHSLRELIELPKRSSVPFELALAIHTDEKCDLEALARNGWNLLDPADAAATPERYREFIRGSWAEFGVAKSGYVHSRCGWFSDRSICYLAAGRPVVAQDTGFSRHLPVGEGILPFDAVDDALDSIAAISRDYDRHSRAARRAAELVFDSDMVLTNLLEQVGAL